MIDRARPTQLRDERASVLNVFGLVLLGAGLLFLFVFNQERATGAAVLIGSGWLARALANTGSSPGERAWRNVEFGLAALHLAYALAHGLSITWLPFTSERPSTVETIVMLAAFILVPIYVLRAYLQPTSDDYKLVQRMMEEQREREREREERRQRRLGG